MLPANDNWFSSVYLLIFNRPEFSVSKNKVSKNGASQLRSQTFYF